MRLRPTRARYGRADPLTLGVQPMRPLHDAGVVLAGELPADGWTEFRYRPGDVVLLHSLSVHEVTLNESDELALFADYRFQDRRVPACVASLEPHHYPRVPGFRTLSRGWTSRRWVRRPPRAAMRRARFLMPASIESWHEVLDPRPSALG